MGFFGGLVFGGIAKSVMSNIFEDDEKESNGTKMTDTISSMPFEAYAERMDSVYNTFDSGEQANAYLLSELRKAQESELISTSTYGVLSSVFSTGDGLSTAESKAYAYSIMQLNEAYEKGTLSEESYTTLLTDAFSQETMESFVSGDRTKAMETMAEIQNHVPDQYGNLTDYYKAMNSMNNDMFTGTDENEKDGSSRPYMTDLLDKYADAGVIDMDTYTEARALIAAGGGSRYGENNSEKLGSIETASLAYTMMQIENMHESGKISDEQLSGMMDALFSDEMIDSLEGHGDEKHATYMAFVNGIQEYEIEPVVEVANEDYTLDDENEIEEEEDVADNTTPGFGYEEDDEHVVEVQNAEYESEVKDATVRNDVHEVLPDYDTYSFKEVELTENDINTLIHDSLYVMGEDKEAVTEPEVYREFVNELKEAQGPDKVEEISEDNLKMLSILKDNDMLSQEELDAYMEGSEEERLEIMKANLTDWLDDPNATGKDTLVANLGVQSMLGDAIEGNTSLKALEIQSIDVLFGSTEDGHVNTFFYNGINGDALYEMNNILENMYENGDIDEDQYLDACESWEAKMMTMASFGNNINEMAAARDALRQDYEHDHEQTPEEAMREFCESQGWDYEDFMNSMKHPEVWDGTEDGNRNAYRKLLVNGEWPQGVDDKYKDAYDIMLLDNAMGETEEEAELMHSELSEALAAGIAAFREVLMKSEVGQKILMICNNIVHSEPINGTLFQEIWDMESGTDNQEYTIPEPTPEPDTPPTSGTPTPGTTEVTTEPTTEPTTDSTTEPTTESTTEPTTESTTEPTTESTTESTSGSTTEVTTESTTEATTESTTEATTESTTEATTESTTEATTTTSEVTSANPNADSKSEGEQTGTGNEAGGNDNTRGGGTDGTSTTGDGTNNGGSRQDQAEQIENSGGTGLGGGTTNVAQTVVEGEDPSNGADYLLDDMGVEEGDTTSLQDAADSSTGTNATPENTDPAPAAPADPAPAAPAPADPVPAAPEPEEDVEEASGDSQDDVDAANALFPGVG